MTECPRAWREEPRDLRREEEREVGSSLRGVRSGSRVAFFCLLAGQVGTAEPEPGTMWFWHMLGWSPGTPVVYL